MELIYSMRRKPLKSEPPHIDSSTDPEVVRPICTISICNIIAFSSLTELSDADGDSWGGHVYVCDIDTPWDAHKVTSTVYPVSALEWDGEGKELLVATSIGDVSVFGQKDYLLNEWTCLYTANFPGERIIQATFFHNGRRVVTIDKKPDLPMYECMQVLKATPTLKGFGGVWCAGACVVSSTGLVGALSAGDGGQALLATECMPPARDHLASASITHKSDGSMLIAASFRRGRQRGVRVSRVSVSRGSSSRCAPLCVQLLPLPTVYLEDDVTPVSVAWWERDDTDTLLIADNNLTLWKMVERAYPVHQLLIKGSPQGSTTPGGAPKGTDCFNTIVWQQAASWQLEMGPATHVSAARPAAPALAAVSSSRALHLLTRDTHHYLVSRPIVTGGSSEVSSEATPPKKANYGGSLPSGVPLATVHSVSVSWLGAACVAIDSHSQIHLFRLQSPADIPAALSVQQVVCQLESGLVMGADPRDVLLTLGGAADTVYDRLTENFQRQPSSFQQYYFHTWLKLRIALCSLSPSSSPSAAALQGLQNALSAWAASGAALRDDRGPGDAGLLAALANDDLSADDKNLLALEAKADLSNEVNSQALQPLQALRRLLQRALYIALTMLASLQPSNLHQIHAHNVYSLHSDPLALSVLRRLVAVSRACGRGGDALTRPLAKLAAGHKTDLFEECVSVCSSWPAREWDAPPRCCVSAPHGRPLPLYLECGVEPEILRYTPEPPLYAQSDTSPSLDMDCIRYMYLGGRGRSGRWRQCGRCGTRALPDPRAAPHALQRAHDGRYIAACRCGGKWTLVSNV